MCHTTELPRISCGGKRGLVILMETYTGILNALYYVSLKGKYSANVIMKEKWGTKHTNFAWREQINPVRIQCFGWINLSICSGQFSGPWWQMHISDILISLLVTVFCEYKPINASRVHRLDRIITVSVTQWSVSRYNGLIAYKREVCVSQCLPRKIQIVRRAPNSISIIL